MPLPVNHTYFLDGSYFLVKSNGISVFNRAFKYGDFIFETIRTKANEPLLLDYHYDRLMRGMDVLRMNKSDLPTITQTRQFIESLINKNRYFADCRVRMTVFRKGEGLYTPETNNISFMLEAKPLDNKGYYWNESGLLVDVYNENVKAKSPISNFKCGNSLISVLASNYKKENLLGDVFILNSDNAIIEASSSNIFWVKGGVFFTPKLTSGCVDGVMRRKIIELIVSLNQVIIETDGASEDLLEWADEIFLTNAIVGVQGVMGFKKRRYYLTKSKQLNHLLNSWYLSA